VFFFHI